MTKTPMIWTLYVSGVLLATTVFAESPHYKKGGQPVCTIDQATGVASCSSGLVTGLGNQDVRVTLSFAATADTVCHNPGNSLEVPGQNPTGVVASVSALIPGSAIKNGNATLPALTVTAIVPVPGPVETGCPNPSWTVTLRPVVYGPGTYTVEQPPGTVLPTLSFTF
jgi:hypothetical protein